MQPIALLILYLLVPLAGYAADTPDKKVSYLAEKAEEVVKNANLLKLKIPTDGGVQEHFVDTTDNEMFSCEPPIDIFETNTAFGLPTFWGTTTSLDDKDESHTYGYQLKPLLQWFLQNGTDPIIRTKTVVNMSAFIIRKLPNTNPPQYKASFLADGQDMPKLVKPLLATATLFADNDQAKARPEIAKAEFYSTVVKESIKGELKKSKGHQEIALKMIKIALEQLDTKKIGTLPYVASCLATAGDVYLAQGNVNFAIQSYSDAFDLTGHTRSFHALNNIYIKLGKDFNDCRIKLLKQQSPIDPNIWHELGLLQKELGQKEQSEESFNKYKTFLNSRLCRRPSILKRSYTTTHEDNESAAAKRAKPSASSSSNIS